MMGEGIKYFQSKIVALIFHSLLYLAKSVGLGCDHGTLFHVAALGLCVARRGTQYHDVDRRDHKTILFTLSKKSIFLSVGEL
jgi:hypothetical protein